MAKEFFLPTPIYLQVDCYKDTNEMCGAACAQMVLHDIDPKRPFTTGGQDQLFKEIRQPPPGPVAWHNPPQGIKRVLHEEKPATRPPQRAVLKPEIQAIFASQPAPSNEPYAFAILGDNGVDESDPNPGIARALRVSDQIEQIELLSRRIIREIALRGVAPIVAVREDNAHWIVVNGFQVEDDYSDMDPDQRGRIKAMMIRNPLGRYVYGNVDCKGLSDKEMQEITGHRCDLNPNEPDVVPYATWVREYMFSDWAETFVVVADVGAQVADSSVDRIKSLSSRAPKKSPMSAICDSIAGLFQASGGVSARSEITGEAAIALAREAIRDFNLSRINPRASAQNTFEPYRVKRLDRIDGDYYLVPVGEGSKISALINISVRGEFNGATVLPLNVPRTGDVAYDSPGAARFKQDGATKEFHKAIAEPNDHYIAPFDEHPKFSQLIAARNSSLTGRTIRLPGSDRAMTIASVVRDESAPYVWRPGPNSFSASRPFHNLKITVREREEPISFYLPVDDYCLPTDENTGDILLPSANYLEMVADCIKRKAGNMIGEALVQINRRGNVAMVMYKSNQTMQIDQELNLMKKHICECLNAHPFAGLTHYRIKAFATNAFLTSLRGGGEDDPIGTAPASGGGANGIPINPCPPAP